MTNVVVQAKYLTDKVKFKLRRPVSWIVCGYGFVLWWDSSNLYKWSIYAEQNVQQWSGWVPQWCAVDSYHKLSCLLWRSDGTGRLYYAGNLYPVSVPGGVQGKGAVWLDKWAVYKGKAGSTHLVRLHNGEWCLFDDDWTLEVMAVNDDYVVCGTDCNCLSDTNNSRLYVFNWNGELLSSYNVSLPHDWHLNYGQGLCGLTVVGSKVGIGYVQQYAGILNLDTSELCYRSLIESMNCVRTVFFMKDYSLAYHSPKWAYGDYVGILKHDCSAHRTLYRTGYNTTVSDIDYFDGGFDVVYQDWGGTTHGYRVWVENYDELKIEELWHVWGSLVDAGDPIMCSYDGSTTQTKDWWYGSGGYHECLKFQYFKWHDWETCCGLPNKPHCRCILRV